MKLKKRIIKYAAIFFLCWFALLVFLVDGVLKFQTLVDYFGSYALVEVSLLLLVILPTWAVYKFTKGDFYKFPVHQMINSKKADMNSFVISDAFRAAPQHNLNKFSSAFGLHLNSGLSLHLADCHSVTMPALLPHAAQPSAKEILQKLTSSKMLPLGIVRTSSALPRLIAFFLKDNL